MENDDSTQAEDTEVNHEFAQLLNRARDGDSDAQQILCEQYESQVRIVIRVLLGPQLRPHLDSMDLMQSVHRSLLAGLRDQKFAISTPRNLVALACTMVRRKVARKWRSHRRQVRLESAGRLGDSLVQTLSSLSNHELGPAKVAEYNNAVVQLCHSLSDIERTMLERRLEGYTTGEVAQELGIHPVAIRVRWSRLKQRLEAAGVFADWI